MDDVLSIAVQKSGRLSEKSLDIIRSCGIDVNADSRVLKAMASGFPLEFLFVRDDDIPGYVADGVADIGIVGRNEYDESGVPLSVVRDLGFASCRLSIAVPHGFAYTGLESLEGKRIATSYPRIVGGILKEKGISAELVVVSGSVEVTVDIGVADAIADLVSTGTTLKMNGLDEVECIYRSSAVMIAREDMDEGKKELLRRLLEREVSEIHDGVVEIVAIARDPGVRTKIAVRSGDGERDVAFAPAHDLASTTVYGILEAVERTGQATLDLGQTPELARMNQEVESLTFEIDGQNTYYYGELKAPDEIQRFLDIQTAVLAEKEHLRRNESGNGPQASGDSELRLLWGRLDLRYELTDGTTLRRSYGLNYYVSELDQPDSAMARLAELDVLLNIDGRGRPPQATVMAKSARPSVLDGLRRPVPPRNPDKKPKHHEQEAR